MYGRKYLSSTKKDSSSGHNLSSLTFFDQNTIINALASAEIFNIHIYPLFCLFIYNAICEYKSQDQMNLLRLHLVQVETLLNKGP